jgi:hypothetical protein
MARGMIEALQMAKEMGKGPAPADGTQENMNPASSNEPGDIIYLPENLTLDGAKKGDKVCVKGSVVSIGNKLGIQPDSVEPEGAVQEGEGQQAQE